MNSSLRRRLFGCSILALSGILVGCGEELSCSSLETQQLVEQIALGEAKKAGLLTPDRPSISFSLSEIITTDKLKAKTICKAKLNMTMAMQGPPEGNRSELMITYNVEKTDDGQLYVTVYGL